MHQIPDTLLASDSWMCHNYSNADENGDCNTSGMLRGRPLHVHYVDDTDDVFGPAGLAYISSVYRDFAGIDSSDFSTSTISESLREEDGDAAAAGTDAKESDSVASSSACVVFSSSGMIAAFEKENTTFYEDVAPALEQLLVEKYRITFNTISPKSNPAEEGENTEMSLFALSANTPGAKLVRNTLNRLLALRELESSAISTSSSSVVVSALSACLRRRKPLGPMSFATAYRLSTLTSAVYSSNTRDLIDRLDSTHLTPPLDLIICMSISSYRGVCEFIRITSNRSNSEGSSQTQNVFHFGRNSSRDCAASSFVRPPVIVAVVMSSDDRHGVADAAEGTHSKNAAGYVPALDTCALSLRLVKAVLTRTVVAEGNMRPGMGGSSGLLHQFHHAVIMFEQIYRSRVIFSVI